MWYSIEFNDNTISIENRSGDGQVFVTLKVSETCDENYTTIISLLEVDVMEVIKLPFRNGIYKIIIEKVSDLNTIVETIEYTYPYFGLLLASILKDMETYFCDCECKECNDCGKTEKERISLVLRVLSYYTLTQKFYPRFYEVIFKCLYCEILDASNCTILNEKVLGNFDNEQLFEKMLSSFYLSFYFIEYYSNSDKEYVNNKFKFNKIKKCIKTSNVDLDCITNNIENNMGVFTTEWEGYINRPPSQVGNYSTGAGNRATLILTPAMFTTLTTPAYADPEGDAAQAIRVDTLPTNGAVLKLGGTPVTAGQIITMTVIASGNFVLEGPDTNSITTSTWNFSVRDVGSMQFTS